MDIVVSVLFIIAIFWWFTALVAIITELTMPGPVFFKQRRTGHLGEEFTILKFRTMVVNSQADTLQASNNDSRITRWGRIMRNTHIDEFPQFINVLLGDMSLVGPRPHMIEHTRYYSSRIGNYSDRLNVRPGITGWAQVNGACGSTYEISKMERRVNLDLWYIENWSIWLDTKIFFKSIIVLIESIFVRNKEIVLKSNI